MISLRWRSASGLAQHDANCTQGSGELFTDLLRFPILTPYSL